MSGPDWILLWTRCLAGDREACRILAEAVYPPILSLFACRTKNEDDACDLTQTFFLRLFEDDKRRLRSFDPSRGVPLLSYLRVIATRQFIDWTRSRGRDRGGRRVDIEKCHELLGVEPDVARKLSMREIHDAVERLPERECIGSTLLLMGLRGPEIARAMGLTEGGVAALLWRARQNLRNALRGGWSDPTDECSVRST